MTEELTLAGLTVEDAHVDWQINCSNRPKLSVQLDGRIDNDDFLPLTGDTVNDRYFQEYDGVVRSFLPKKEDRNRKVVTVKHEDGSEIEGVWSYEHMTTDISNRTGMYDVLEVTTKEKYTKNRTCTVERIKEIIDEFVNGDMGSETVSYWVWRRDKKRYKWNQATNKREDYEGYITPKVTIVRKKTNSWTLKRIEDVTEDDTVWKNK